MKRNQPGWGPAAQPQQHYLVNPRHLAGGGDISHVTDYLTGANWKNRTPRSGSPLLFETRNKWARIGYFPDANPPAWTISGSPSQHPELSWQATIGAAVPVEILAGLAEALSQPRPTHAPNVLGQMTARGWTNGTGKHPTAGHPDGTGLMQFRSDSSTWVASAHTPGPGRTTVPLWTAVFSEHTPRYVVEAFAAALADPAPLLRPPGHIPHIAAAHVRATPYAVLPSQLTAMRQARAAAGRAAAWARNAPQRVRNPFRAGPSATAAFPPRPTRPPTTPPSPTQQPRTR